MALVTKEDFHLPQTWLSLSRIPIAVVLTVLATYGAVVPFVVLFVIGCLTDFFDGMIARKTNTSSNNGAKIDSIADYFMYYPVPLWFWLLKPDIAQQFLYPLVVLVGFIILVEIIRIFGARAGKDVSALHLYSGKFTCIVLFAVFPFLLLGDFTQAHTVLIWGALIVSTFGHLEFLFIILFHPRPSSNMKWFGEHWRT